MNADVHHDLASILHLTPKQVSLGLALFYVSYVLFDLPSNLIMSRLSPRVWMSRIVFAVGLIGACFAATKAAWSLFLLRFLLGLVTAGMWPGMAYYLTLFYPPSRTGKRIGYYFSAAQLSAAVVGLVSAGFQKMDGLHGLVGFQWMFLVYGVLGAALGIALLWWLPERPLIPGQTAPEKKGLLRWLPSPAPILTGEDAEIHYRDLGRVYHVRPWTARDLLRVLADWRLWPLVIMYFGVVGVGIGTQLYGSKTPPRGSISLNCCTRRVTTYPASISALCCPKHMREPPLKGRYAQPGRSGFSESSQRPGLNSSASDPYTSGKRCIVHTQ